MQTPWMVTKLGKFPDEVWQEYGDTAQRLRNTSYIWDMTIINAVLEAFCCTIWDHFLTKRERVNMLIYRRFMESEKICLTGWTLLVLSTRKQLKILAKSDVESICVQLKTLKDTDATTWIGKHFQQQFSFLQFLWRSLFFFASMTPITSLHPSSELWKVWLHREKHDKIFSNLDSQTTLMKNWLAPCRNW